MYWKDFLKAVIDAKPSRDDTHIYIHEYKDDYEVNCYEIIDISDEGSNDSIVINIKKVD